MKKYLSILVLLMFILNTSAQINGKVISPSFSQVSNLVSYTYNSSATAFILKNNSSFKLEVLYLSPTCCDVQGPNKNTITSELNNNLQPGESMKISATYKGTKYFRAIVYKSKDMELKSILGENPDIYKKRYDEHNNRGCELSKLQAKMGGELCTAINGSNSCFEGVDRDFKKNNWCNAQTSPQNTVNTTSPPSPQISISQTPVQSQYKNSPVIYNNAIETTVNTVFDLIRSGKARKENTGKAIVNSFARDVYERKKNIKYYDDILCTECSGSGTLVYNDNPNGLLYGQSYPCSSCNGIGRINKLKPEYGFTTNHSKPFLDFGKYLVELVETKVPLSTFYPAGYKGSVQMVVIPKIGGHVDDLVIMVTTIFRFLDKKGKLDADGYIYNTVSEEKIFPLHTIESFEYIPAESKNIEGTAFEYNAHVLLRSSIGESYEFPTSIDAQAATIKLNELLKNAKSATNTSAENKLGGTNTGLTSKSTAQETIKYINSKMACCMIGSDGEISSYDKILFSKSGSVAVSSPSAESNYQIYSINNGTLEFQGEYKSNQFKRRFDLNIAECLQQYQNSVYFIKCKRKDDNSIDTEIITKLLFSNEEIAKEVYDGIIHLKSLKQ